MNNPKTNFKKNRCFFAATICAFFFHANTWAIDVPKWGLFETSINNTKDYDNKFRDVILEAEFTSPKGKKITFWGFFDGDGSGGPNRMNVKQWKGNTGGEITGTVWKLRFMPNEIGKWAYNWKFSDNSKSGQGDFHCVAKGAKPGPLNVDRKNNGRWARNDLGPKLLAPVYLISGDKLSNDINTYKPVYDKHIKMGFNFFCWPWLPLWAWNTGQNHKKNNGGQSDAFALIWYQKKSYSGHPYGETGKKSDYDTDRMNLFTWKRLDQHLSYLAEKGIYTVGFQGFNIKRTWPIMPHQFDREKYDWYIRYAMARLAPYYNAVWNNTWESINGAKWLWENLDKKGMDPWRRLRINVEKSTEDANDKDRKWDKIPNSSNKMEFVVEDNNGTGLWGPKGSTGWGSGTANIKDQKDVLRIALKLYLKGAIAFPVEYINSTNTHEWSKLGKTKGFIYLGHLFTWLQSNGLGFENMLNHDELVSQGGKSAFCLANPGKEYLIFKEKGGTVKLNLKNKSGKYSLIRVNPFSGASKGKEIIEGGGEVELMASNDFNLMHIKSAETVKLIRPLSDRSTNRPKFSELQFFNILGRHFNLAED